MNTSSLPRLLSLTVFAFTLLAGCGGHDTGKTTLLVSAAPVAQPAEYVTVVQQLYIAYFGRPADSSGLVNFENALSAAGAPTNIQGFNAAYSTNSSIKNLIDSFGVSDESNSLYGGDTKAFATAVYQGLFNRAPDAAGLAFWVGAINSGTLTKANASLSIMAGALVNTTTQGLLDAQLVNNKVLGGTNFTKSLIAAPVDGYRGNAAAASARAMLSNITASTDMLAFQPTIDALIASLAASAATTAPTTTTTSNTSTITTNTFINGVTTTTLSKSTTSITSTITAANMNTALAALDATLPSEPVSPSSLCATLNASLPSSAFSSPSATDPGVDNAAAIAAAAINSNPDTARIQAALSACPKGQAVKLISGGGNNAFLAGALTLPSGVALWIDTDVTLYASRNPADFNAGRGASDACGDASSSTSSSGCKSFITLPAGATSSSLFGPGAIDGRGGSVLTGGPKAGIMTWWDVALLNKVYGYSQNTPILIDLSAGGNNFTLYQVKLLNAPHFHVKSDAYNGITAWGVQLITPTLAYSVNNYACAVIPSTTVAATKPGTCYTPDTVKNTDGIDFSGSIDTTIAYSYISVGDDNIAITASNGVSGCANKVATYCISKNTKIAHNFLYYGHGLSVGSGTQGGVTDLAVWDISMDGRGSGVGGGLRIKTYPGAGGEVSATYTKVCMKDVKGPISIDPYYSTATSTTALQPNLHDIKYIGIHGVNAAGATYPTSTNWTNVINGVSATNLLTNVVFDNVYFDPSSRGDPTWGSSSKGSFSGSPNYATIKVGPGSTSFTIPTSGAGVTITGTPATATGTAAIDCSTAFPTLKSVNPLSPI